MPFLEDAIMVANHNIRRTRCEDAQWVGGAFGDEGCAAGPREVFGRPVMFTSLWRYKAGSSRLSALRRAGRPVGTEEMKVLMQTVSEGLTEMSMIVRPNDLEFEFVFFFNRRQHRRAVGCAVRAVEPVSLRRGLRGQTVLGAAAPSV
ncbi:unnamed protein product [Prorocentrum cordatum]|uniref:Uncharacterized protein n=1 Tax=Prorocentrum cordatum TaxID=2364126 RepID=A0ABN9V286_9DINO|nr:unnamed protein product [Polarella glacialis]